MDYYVRLFPGGLTFYKSFVVSDNIWMLELFADNGQLTDDVPNTLLSFLATLTPRWAHCVYLSNTDSTVKPFLLPSAHRDREQRGRKN